MQTFFWRPQNNISLVNKTPNSDVFIQSVSVITQTEQRRQSIWARIFDNQNFWRCACTTSSYTTAFNYRWTTPKRILLIYLLLFFTCSPHCARRQARKI